MLSNKISGSLKMDYVKTLSVNLTLIIVSH
jgi:hypothetical protein